MKAMRKIFSLLMALTFALTAWADNDDLEYFQMGWVPEKPQQLVNDYAELLTPEQQQTLEDMLVAFNDSTSNQIVVLITPGLGGDDIAHFTQNVWKEWGVGQEGLNNGAILVVKPKNLTKGQVRIQVGYGLEGAMPDIYCKHIIDDVMIPHFQNDEYYEGIAEALEIIKQAASGEYTYANYKSDERLENIIVLLIICAIFIAIFFIMKRTGGSLVSYSTGPFVGSSMGSSGGLWTDFSHGGGSFGGFGGGFSGFGGGMSGGGGASGSW